MDKTPTIWARLGSWLRTGSGTDLETTAADEPLNAGVLTKPAITDKHTRIGGPLAGWSRRDHTLQQIQEGNERLMEVLGSIKTYMDNQEQRSDQIAESLGAVADTFSKLPALTEQQTEVLTGIAATMEQNKDHARDLADAMRDTPDAIRTQGEAIRSFQGVLEVAHENDGKMAAMIETMLQAQGKLQTKLIQLMITVVVLLAVGGIVALIALSAG